jgi:hypothetical protein
MTPTAGDCAKDMSGRLELLDGKRFWTISIQSCQMRDVRTAIYNGIIECVDREQRPLHQHKTNVNNVPRRTRLTGQPGK